MLASGEVKAGLVYGSEAKLAMRDNPAIKIVYPEEFLSFFQSNWVIPKEARNPELAHKFINHDLRPEVNKDVVMENPLNTPNVETLKILPEDIRKEIDIPEEEIKRGEYAVDLGEATIYFDRVWSEVKSQ